MLEKLFFMDFKNASLAIKRIFLAREADAVIS